MAMLVAMAEVYGAGYFGTEIYDAKCLEKSISY